MMNLAFYRVYLKDYLGKRVDGHNGSKLADYFIRVFNLQNY